MFLVAWAISADFQWPLVMWNAQAALAASMTKAICDGVSTTWMKEHAKLRPTMDWSFSQRCQSWACLCQECSKVCLCPCRLIQSQRKKMQRWKMLLILKNWTSSLELLILVWQSLLLKLFLNVWNTQISWREHNHSAQPQRAESRWHDPWDVSW